MVFYPAITELQEMLQKSDGKALSLVLPIVMAKSNIEQGVIREPLAEALFAAHRLAQNQVDQVLRENESELQDVPVHRQIDGKILSQYLKSPVFGGAKSVQVAAKAVEKALVNEPLKGDRWQNELEEGAKTVIENGLHSLKQHEQDTMIQDIRNVLSPHRGNDIRNRE
jgi:hypothetical protein